MTSSHSPKYKLKKKKVQNNMAKFYKVSKAFQATVSKEDKTPVTDEHGNVKFMFQVEGQGKEGWMSIQRKPGGTLEAGDYVYGIVDEWDNGKAKFVRQQVPDGVEYPADAPKRESTPAPAAAPAEDFTANVSTELVHDKLDYIIGLVEAIADKVGAEDPTPSTTAPGNNDLDDLDI